MRSRSWTRPLAPSLLRARPCPSHQADRCSSSTSPAGGRRVVATLRSAAALRRRRRRSVLVETDPFLPSMLHASGSWMAYSLLLHTL